MQIGKTRQPGKFRLRGMQVWETGYPGNECPAGAFGSDCAPLSLAVSGWSKASEPGLDGR